MSAQAWLKSPLIFYGGVALIVYLVARNAGSLTRALAGGAVGSAGDAVAGAAKGIGDAFGIPDTDADACARALAEGRYWDASFDCPAADFLKGWWGTSSPEGAPVLERPGGGATGSW